MRGRDPIPVKQAGLTSTVLQTYKCGTISFFSEELATRSVPEIETVVRIIMAEDTGAFLNSILLGSAAGSAVQPPGLFYNVTPITPATGGGQAAVVKDISALLSAIAPAADPVLISDTATHARAVGLCPGYAVLPWLETPAMAAGKVGAIDAAAFLSAEGDQPKIDASNEAVLHAETVPLAIGTPGTPPVVAAPSHSLWQQDLIVLRLLQFLTWGMRDAGKVAVTGAVTW